MVRGGRLSKDLPGVLDGADPIGAWASGGSDDRGHAGLSQRLCRHGVHADKGHRSPSDKRVDVPHPFRFGLSSHELFLQDSRQKVLQAARSCRSESGWRRCFPRDSLEKYPLLPRLKTSAKYNPAGKNQAWFEAFLSLRIQTTEAKYNPAPLQGGARVLPQKCCMLHVEGFYNSKRPHSPAHRWDLEKRDRTCRRAAAVV